MASASGAQFFAELATEYVTAERASRSTMMGFPCLRRDGAFFASVDPRTDALIVKLSAERVAQLVQEGVGSPFAPSGRIFREWVALPTAHRSLWSAVLEEAWTTAGPRATQC